MGLACYFISFALVFHHATCTVLPTVAAASVPSTTRERLSNRIIGGTEASPDEFPFFVKWGDNCAASLIWHDIILSTAQCNRQAINDVIVGAYQANVTTNTFARNITARKVHPQYNEYNERSYEYDFLVMKLDSEVPISTTPVSLNGNMSYPTNNQLLTTIGFGVTSESSSMRSSILRKVTVPVVDTQVCTYEYGLKLNGAIELCAGSIGKDACYGDAGSPLFDSDNIQVGIVSFGRGCAQLPGVYSRISGVIDWIKQQICDLSDNPPTSCPEKVPTTEPTSAPTRVPSSSKPTLRAPSGLNNTNAPHRTPTKPTSKPVKPTHKPVKPTHKPIKPTSKPIKPTSKPTSKPVKPTFKPVKKPSKPVKPSPKPFKPVSPFKPV